MKLRKLLLLGITILLVGLIAPAIATASDTALSSQSKTADETSNRLHDLESRAKALEGKTDRMITQADDIQRKQQQLETDQAKKTWQMSTWWIIAPLFVSALSLATSIFFSWCARDHNRRSVKPLPFVLQRDFEDQI